MGCTPSKVQMAAVAKQRAANNRSVKASQGKISTQASKTDSSSQGSKSDESEYTSGTYTDESAETGEYTGESSYQEETEEEEDQQNQPTAQKLSTSNKAPTISKKTGKSRNVHSTARSTRMIAENISQNPLKAPQFPILKGTIECLQKGKEGGRLAQIANCAPSSSYDQQFGKSICPVKESVKPAVIRHEQYPPRSAARATPQTVSQKSIEATKPNLKTSTPILQSNQALKVLFGAAPLTMGQQQKAAKTTNQVEKVKLITSNKNIPNQNAKRQKREVQTQKNIPIEQSIKAAQFVKSLSPIDQHQQTKEVKNLQFSKPMNNQHSKGYDTTVQQLATVNNVAQPVKTPSKIKIKAAEPKRKLINSLEEPLFGSCIEQQTVTPQAPTIEDRETLTRLIAPDHLPNRCVVFDEAKDLIKSSKRLPIDCTHKLALDSNLRDKGCVVIPAGYEQQVTTALGDRINTINRANNNNNNKDFTKLSNILGGLELSDLSKMDNYSNGRKNTNQSIPSLNAGLVKCQSQEENSLRVKSVDDSYNIAPLHDEVENWRVYELPSRYVGSFENISGYGDSDIRAPRP